MRKLDIALRARAEIASTLQWSEEHFGQAAALRYELLIRQGLVDIAHDPHRPGSTLRPELGPGVYVIHLAHSRARASDPPDRVKHPRHVLVFRLTDESVEVLRVLHESADPVRHLTVD
jgi:toxin ParE1/3/4